MNLPLQTGRNGRNPDGTFALGNRAAVGNTHAGRVAKLRTILLKTVTDDDVRAIVSELVKLARGGDLVAIREVLNRTIGRPEITGLAERDAPEAFDPERINLALANISTVLGFEPREVRFIPADAPIPPPAELEE